MLRFVIKIRKLIKIPTLHPNSEYWGENCSAGKDSQNWEDSSQIKMVGSSEIVWNIYFKIFLSKNVLGLLKKIMQENAWDNSTWKGKATDLLLSPDIFPTITKLIHEF